MNVVSLSSQRIRDLPRDPWTPVFAQAFGQFLVAGGWLSAEAAQRAERAARETGERFDVVVGRLGLVSETELAKAVARYLSLPVLEPSMFPDAPIEVPGFGADVARRINGLVLADDAEGLTVAVADPFEAGSETSIMFHSGRPAKLVVAAAGDIQRLHDRLYGAGAPERGDVAATAKADENDVRRLTDMASDAPVVRLVQDTIRRAVEAEASDIHIEPSGDGLVVRNRIDGELMRTAVIPVDQAAAVLSRIKIMARLNIAERRLPQDGRIHVTVRGRDVELRVATMPTLAGESVVLRILDRGRVALDFASLGFSATMRAQLNELMARPNGLVLVTGPTGSGKSTTLYAALSGLDRTTRKIFTIEDPVETHLAGIAQVQVHPKIGLTFANTLRSVLRHDPNVIMVGEIRDLDTAQIAMQASLTGHLVLSTLHTNSALATLPRLVDMGVENYLVASTLRATLAQRLVRCLCGACAKPARSTAALVACIADLRERGIALDVDPGGMKEAVGCPACRGTGYRGRVAIAELLIVDDAVASALVAQPGARDLEAAARAAGMRPLLADGIEKVCRGVTTLDEALRVTRGM
ncbi:MAG: hypothetical protein RL291_1157 [Pseudomonadota bacterium]